MKTSSLRQVIVAMTIAVCAATVHGAWFASTDARVAAPAFKVSTWDYYEKSWTSATHDLALYTVDNPLTLRHSEDTIVAISGATLSLPAGLNTEQLDDQELALLGIPPVVGATHLHLLVSKPSNLLNSWPVVGGGSTDPTDADRSALDVDGSVGVHAVTVEGSQFTWDIGRWSKGDIFLGLNNHTYKVLDRHGNFKRFVASADYDEYHNDAKDEDYNVTTGCATNWKTGEVFATNFADYYPAVNIIGRHAVDSDLSPYSQASRRILTRIDRTDDAQTAYANKYTSVNYPIDSSPESVAFDADMNMYVGHSFGNFRQAPASWAARDAFGEFVRDSDLTYDPLGNIEPVAGKVFEFNDEWTEYTMAVDGLPLEGWSWDDGWGWSVDETGVRMLLAPAGSAVGAFTEKIYGVEVSPRLSYDANGSLVTVRARDVYPAVSGLPDWNPNGRLPQSFLSDPATGTALYRQSNVGSLIPSRWSMGKRLHKYAPLAGNYLGSEGVDGDAGARREAFWTFSGRQGTDWIDLDVTGEVMYYTSEDSFIHRYRVKASQGQAVGQLPDVGADLVIDGQPTFGKLALAQEVADGMTGGSVGNYRFHGLRILPPGDGTGGFLVAVGDGNGVHRFDKDGKWVQRYWAHADSNPNSNGGKSYLIGNWYTIEVDPGGRTFWASAHDTGKIFQFDIATGSVLKTIDAVQYRSPAGTDPGSRVEGICIMWEYTAPQEICFNADGTKQGQDDDGDGYIDENCVAIEVCSAVSPGDDDGDNLPNQYDPDCAAELPPVAINDAYRMRQKEYTPVTRLTEPAADGVLTRGDDDHDSDADSTLTVIAGGTTEALLDPLSATSITTANGGSVVLQSDGSFVYTPLAEFHGVDTFAYRITDGYPSDGPVRTIPTGGDLDDIATVTIIVEPKVADDGIYQVIVGETVSRGATGAGALLANDAQFPAASSAGPVTVMAAWDPLMGGRVELAAGTREFLTDNGNEVTVNADGSFSFTALNLTYFGQDTFWYDVHDTESRSWNHAIVTVNVNPLVVTVTVPDREKTYDGTPLPTTCTVTSSRPAPYEYTLTYKGTTRGGVTYGPTPTAPTAAGTYTANCVYTDPSLGEKTNSGQIVIAPRPLVATANDKTMVLGGPMPTLDGTLTGVVAGEVINVTYTNTNSGTVVGVHEDVLLPTVTASAGVLANYEVTEIPGTLTVVAVAPCTGNGGYTTYSQGGWGSTPSGNNPGALLASKFSTVYGNGPVVIGSGYTLTFTTAKAIENFLPGGGTSKPLTGSDINPRKSAAGNIAAQLLALRLATDFSAAGITKSGLGFLVMQSGPLAGKTVNEILAIANAVVGGQPGALPAGLSITGLASILESLNLNYHEGTVNQGLLSCTGGTPAGATN